MPRLRFISALIVLSILATALVACGDEDGGGSSSGGDPQTVLDDATLEGVKSGVLDLTLAIDAEGKEEGDVDISLSGPFQGAGGKGEQPQFDLDADIAGSFGDEEIDFEGGLVLLPNSAYVNYEGTEYEVDPTTFTFVESYLEQLQRQGGAEGGSTTACQEAASKLEVGNFVDNLSDDGSADVEGTGTTKVSGDLDVPGAIDALVDLAEDPACSSQVGAAGELPSESEIGEAKDQVSEAVKRAHIDVYVGDDDIIRQISAQLDIAPEDGSASGGPESAKLDFDLKLAEVNEEPEISAPQGAKPLSDLFVKLDINPLELLDMLEGGGLDSLLEGFGAAAGGGSGGGSGGGGDQQAYLKCLGEARTPVDLQKCAKLAG